MPVQLKTVNRSRQDQGICSHCRDPLPAGTPYRYYKPGFRSKTKIRVCMKSECTPRRSQLDQSKLSDAFAAIETAEDAIANAETVEAVQNAIDECASAIRDVSGEYEDTISNTPMLEDQLREKIDALDSFADELESLSLDEEPEKPEPPREPNRQDFASNAAFDESHSRWHSDYTDFEGELEDWKHECEEALETAKQEAIDVLSATEF